MKSFVCSPKKVSMKALISWSLFSRFTSLKEVSSPTICIITRGSVVVRCPHSSSHQALGAWARPRFALHILMPVTWRGPELAKLLLHTGDLRRLLMTASISSHPSLPSEVNASYQPPPESLWAVCCGSLFIRVSKFEQCFQSLPALAQSGPSSVPWKEKHIWAGLQGGAVAFTTTDSCICFWAGRICLYVKTQWACRAEFLHFHMSFLVAPSLEGFMNTFHGPGYQKEMLWAADNQLIHWAWRTASFWEERLNWGSHLHQWDLWGIPWFPSILHPVRLMLVKTTTINK